MLNIEVVDGRCELKSLAKRQSLSSPKPKKKNIPIYDPSTASSASGNETPSIVRGSFAVSGSTTPSIIRDSDSSASGTPLLPSVQDKMRSVHKISEVIKKLAEEEQKVTTKPVLDEIFGPDWETRKKHLRNASPVGNLQGWGKGCNITTTTTTTTKITTTRNSNFTSFTYEERVESREVVIVV